MALLTSLTVIKLSHVTWAMCTEESPYSAFYFENIAHCPFLLVTIDNFTIMDRLMLSHKLGVLLFERVVIWYEFFNLSLYMKKAD